MNYEILIEMLGFSGSCFIIDSTLFVKEDQSTPLQRHMAFLGMAGWYLILWLITMAVGRWSELPKGSASVHDVLVDQLQPQSNKSGVLSFPVIRLVQSHRLKRTGPG